MNAIILCGGLSTRLGDITKTTPKVLLRIGDRTVFDWQLEKLASLGVSHVVLAAGHLSNVLRDAVGDERQGIRLTHAVEKERLGTGGAIKHALTHVHEPEEPTIILNGDILTTLPLRDMVESLVVESEGVILGSKVSDASTYGTLDYDPTTKQLKAFREKEGVVQPGYINGGFYIFTPHAHRYFPGQSAFSMEYDVFPQMKNLFIYESDHPWIDIGVPDRLQWARDNWQTFL